jgi:hypothetical protein
MKLDEFMPEYDVAARYDISVQASPAETATALEHADFSELRLTRLLLGFRTLGRKRPDSSAGTQVERLRRAGFIELANVPQREIVFGVVGRFWRPDSGIITGLSAEEVIAFHTEGYAKAVWNFAIAAESERVTRVSTETRIHPFGRPARWKFRAYWLVVGPFSGVIRKEMLAMIKRNAEAIAGGSSSALAS